MNIKVEITQEDIDNGVKDSPYGLPTALAVKRTMPLGAEVKILGDLLYIDGYTYEYLLRLPRAAVEFELQYRYGGSPKPFTFTLTNKDIVR